jgi:hypothetical protein
MLADLGPKGKRAWDVLEAVLSNRIRIGDLYDAYRNNDLDHLRERMRDVDLEPKIADGKNGSTDRSRRTRVAIT